MSEHEFVQKVEMELRAAKRMGNTELVDVLKEVVMAMLKGEGEHAASK